MDSGYFPINIKEAINAFQTFESIDLTGLGQYLNFLYVEIKRFIMCNVFVIQGWRISMKIFIDLLGDD